MTAAFQPLSAIAPKELIEYLGREGNSPEIVQWKYFDSRFNRGRERGYCWVKDGKIGGFIGLIPFQVMIDGRVADAAWTCDWSVQDQSSRGIGILLIRQAQERYDYLTQLGGNEATQKIISRLAAITVNDAGIMFYLPLRLGAVLRLARRRLPQFPFDALPFVNRVPLRWPGRSKSHGAVVVEAGVSPVLGEFLEPRQRGEMYSRYDFEYLQWAVGDCPILASETCYIPGGSRPLAAALLWREKASTDFWRTALWWRENATEEAEALLSYLIRHVYELGGSLLSVVVSRLEASSIGVFRRHGFRVAPRRRPLHIIDSKKTGRPVPELWPLSYLDTDFAYRFWS